MLKGYSEVGAEEGAFLKAYDISYRHGRLNK